MQPLLAPGKVTSDRDVYAPHPGSQSGGSFRPTSASGILFNGTLLAFDGCGTCGVHYLPIVEGETGWTTVECTGTPPHATAAPPLTLLSRQRMYVLPPGPITDGLCDAFYLSLDPKQRTWSETKFKCPDSWSSVPSGCAVVQPQPAGSPVLVHGGGEVFQVNPTSNEITLLCETPSVGSLSGHTAFKRGEDILIVGGTKDDGTSGEDVWLIRDPFDGDYSSEEMVGKLPADYTDGFYFMFDHQKSRLCWLGPTELMMEIDDDTLDGDAEWIEMMPAKGGKRKTHAPLSMLSQALVVYGENNRTYITGGASVGDDALYVVEPTGAMATHTIAKDTLMLSVPPSGATVARKPAPPSKKRDAGSSKPQTARDNRRSTAPAKISKDRSASPMSARSQHSFFLPTMPRKPNQQFWEKTPKAPASRREHPLSTRSKRHEAKVSTRNQAVSDQILANLLQAHHTRKSDENIVPTLRHAQADEDNRVLSLVGCSVHIDDLFLVREVLSRCRHLIELDISQLSFDAEESQLIVNIVKTTPTLLAVHANGTKFTPDQEKICEDIDEAVEANNNAKEQQDAEAGAAKQARAEKKAQRRKKRQEKLEKQLAKERDVFNAQTQCAAARIEQREEYQRINLMQTLERDALAIEAKEDVDAIERHIAHFEAVKIKLAEEWTEMELGREKIEKEEVRTRVELGKQRQKEWSVFTDAIRERKKQIRGEMSEVRRESTAMRNQVKAEEKDEFDSFWREWKKFKKQVELHVLEIQRQLNLKLEFESKQRAARHRVLDDEETIRNDTLDTEAKRWKEIKKEEYDDAEEIRRRRQEAIRKQREAEAEAKRLAQLKKNHEERCRQRTEMNKVAPTIVVHHVTDSRNVVINDALPLPVVVPEGRPATAEPLMLELKPPMPDFMKLKNDPINQQFEEGEIENSVWCEQKCGLLAAKVECELVHPPGGMTLTFIPPAGTTVEGNALGAGAQYSIGSSDTNSNTQAAEGDDEMQSVETQQQDVKDFATHKISEEGLHTISLQDISTTNLLHILSGFHIEQDNVPLGAVQESVECVIAVECDCPDPDDEGNPVKATYSLTVSLAITGPVIAIPPSQTKVIYTEGDAAASFFKGAKLQGAAAHQSFLGSTLTVRMLPCEDPDDYFGLYASGSIKYNSDDPRRIAFNGSDFAEIVTQGHLKLPGKKLVPGKPNTIPPTEIRFNANANADNVGTLIRSLQFRNDSENPIEGTRRMIVGVSFTSGLRVHTAVTVEVVGTDDPTVIDFGFASIPYRVPPAVPQQHEEFVDISSCYFASACNVFDVDTTTFSGGHLTLTLSGAKPKEELAVEPLPGATIAVNEDYTEVYFNGKEIASLKAEQQRLHFQFCDSSIEAVQALFKTFVFRTAETVPPSTSIPRVVDIVFVCGDAAPVKTKCQLKITAPLVSLAVKDAFWTFQEDAGLTPVGNFQVCLEDDGWDSGFILVEYCRGHNADDDLLSIKESNLVKFDENDVPPSRRKSVHRRSDAGPPEVKKEESGNLEKSNTMSPRSVADLKSLMRKRVAEKVKALNEARQKAVEELKLRILEETRNRRVSNLITEKTEKPIYVEGVHVGTVQLAPDSLMIQFNPYTGNDINKPRAQQCAVRRSHVATLLRHICYQNVSDNPTDLQKIFRVTASDGTPHTSISTVEVEISPSDDATELRRLNHDPKLFRSQSPQDHDGFVFHKEVTLHDPDTFSFNGAILTVELIGGGDPKGDQLGFLTAQQQAKHGIPEVDRITNADGQLTYHGRVIGSLSVDNQGNWIKVAMTPMPEGVTEPHSMEELQANEDLLSILVVEKCLHCITYTNVSSANKVKQGQRVYQAKVDMNGVEGKIKTTLNVLKPLLENPEYGAQLRYKENDPPVVCFPKLQINFNDKHVHKSGTVTVSIKENKEELDVLNVCIPSKSEYAVDKKGAFMCGKDFIGNVTVDVDLKTVELAMDWASKATVKHLQAFGRFVAFSSTSENPSTEPRQIDIDVHISKEDFSRVSTEISVLAEDDPTEVVLKSTSFDAVRDGPAVLIAAEADVEDPDTQHFEAPSYVEFEMKSATSADHLFLAGFEDATEIHGFTEEAADKVIAKLSRHAKTKALKIELLDIDIEDVQRLVRTASVRFEANPKDKTTKKSIVVSVQSGTAPLFRTQLGVEVAPPLLEPPSALLEKGVTFKGGMVDVFPQMGVHPSHFTGGADVRISFFPDDDAITPVQHQLAFRHPNKNGVSRKENRDDGSDTLLVDGKKVADVDAGAAKHTLIFKVAAFPQGGNNMQKLLRSVVFDSMAEDLPSPQPVYIKVVDLGKELTSEATVTIH